VSTDVDPIHWLDFYNAACAANPRRDLRLALQEMPHLEDKILSPSRLSAEGVLFDVPLRAYPGKPIVCMFPREVSRQVEWARHALPLQIPPEVADKYQPDFGVVAKFAPRRAVQPPSAEPLPGGLDRRPSRSGRDEVYPFPWDLELKSGMLVAVKPYTGVWFTHADFSWIPEGRVLKILGTVEDWSENVLARVED